jgi:hypothetical protein
VEAHNDELAGLLLAGNPPCLDYKALDVRGDEVGTKDREHVALQKSIE